MTTTTNSSTDQQRNDATHVASASERERDELLARVLTTNVLTLQRLGHLRGDDLHVPYPGPHCYRLWQQAVVRKLRCTEDPIFLVFPRSRRERDRIEVVPVARHDFATWLSTFGTDEDRASHLGKWARYCNGSPLPKG